MKSIFWCENVIGIEIGKIEIKIDSVLEIFIF